MAAIVPDDTVAWIADLMAETVGRRAVKLKEKLNRRVDKIRDQRSAIEATVCELAQQLGKFRAEFPDSDLARREQD